MVQAQIRVETSVFLKKYSVMNVKSSCGLHLVLGLRLNVILRILKMFRGFQPQTILKRSLTYFSVFGVHLLFSLGTNQPEA